MRHSGKVLTKEVDGLLSSIYSNKEAAKLKEKRDALLEEMKNGLEIKPVKGISAGFRLASKDGSGYFDCSDDEIMQMLKPFFRNMDF